MELFPSGHLLVLNQQKNTIEEDVKVNNKDTRMMSFSRSGVCIVNFEDNSHHILVFLLLTLRK